MTFSEILQKNADFERNSQGPFVQISLLSNIIVNQLKPILEYNLRSNGILVKVATSDYDNIVQESTKTQKDDIVVIFWETCNLIDGLQYKSNILSVEELKTLIDRFKDEIYFTINNLSSNKLVIINKFSTLIFNNYYLQENQFDIICNELNHYLLEVRTPNIVIVDTEKVISKISISEAIDYRSFYSSKSLYKVNFYKEYCKFIYPIISSIYGKAKKALILDCDNTLWNGIIGEDNMNGIFMSSTNSKGVMFEEIQYIAKDLAKKGIILGLNSKNNEADVDQVINNHDNFSLNANEIVIKKVNWNDKVSNLKEIAKELNIGIDSLVFVDDSDFEINLVNELIPQVTSIQVPKERYMYPHKLRENYNLFYNITVTQEDLDRVAMYKASLLRDAKKESYVDITEYLKSLDLEITIFKNSKEHIPRIAQLTQKTNQFNLTTKRYTENEIEDFITSPNAIVYAFNVADKYGSFGLTGVLIAVINENTATVDTFLMSCRVIGRNIESAFIEEVMNDLKKVGVQTLKATFLKTSKNEQTEFFYEKMNFNLLQSSSDEKNYEFELNNIESNKESYIQINYGK